MSPKSDFCKLPGPHAVFVLSFVIKSNSKQAHHSAPATQRAILREHGLGISDRKRGYGGDLAVRAPQGRRSLNIDSWVCWGRLPALLPHKRQERCPVFPGIRHL